MKGIVAGAIALGVLAAACWRLEEPDTKGRSDCSKLPLRHESIALRDAEIDEALAGHEIDSPELRQSFDLRDRVRPEGSAWIVGHPAEVEDENLRLGMEGLPIDWDAESLLLADPAEVDGMRRFAIRDETLEIHLATERPCLEPEQGPGYLSGREPTGNWLAFRIPKLVKGVRVFEHPATYRVPRPDPEGRCTIVEAQHAYRQGWHTVMKNGSGYRMWAKSWRDGCSGTGSQCADLFYADSSDGLLWDLTPAEERLLEFEEGASTPAVGLFDPPAIVRDESGRFWLFHLDFDDLHASQSEDGIRWVDAGTILEWPQLPGDGPVSPQSLGALRHAGSFWVWIEARRDSDLVSRIYLVRSEDDGRSWVLVGDGPALHEGLPGSFDELGVGKPQVIRRDGRFVMIYEARYGGGIPIVPMYRRLAIAESDDGIQWTKRSRPLPIPDSASVGRHVDSPSVVGDPDLLRVWFADGQGSIYLASCPW